MTRVAVMGECMIELSHLDDRTLALGYAGDVYNVAVSLARWGTEVAFVSRLGDDHHSAAMLDAWREEGLDTSLTDQLPGYAPGLYMIRTDGDGERSFTYWRSASPARELLADDAHAEHVRTGLAGTDWLLLSGISLSLLSDAAHARLLALLDALTAAGTRVAFDSNYRPAGWPDAATAAARMDEVLARTALALPTLDDEQALHGDRDAEATLRRIAALGVEEVVVKLGADGALVQGELVPAEPGVDVVDTTGAGDAFDAGYLHARLARPRARRRGRRGRAPGRHRAAPPRGDRACRGDARPARARMRLEGRHTLITGAGSGIGRAIAERFAREGASVLAVGRTQATLDETAELVRAAGGEATTAALDVADADAVAALFAGVESLDVLVNGAGIVSTHTAEDTPDELWDEVFATNVRGTFLMSKHAMPLLRASKGAIVNVASVAGLVGVPNRAAYCASKGAVLALTRAMAIDHVGEGVRVNALCPGTTQTPWIERLVAEQGERLEDLEARQPLGRLGTAEEMADGALYLASAESSFVTGTELVVDGGMTAR